ncbi:ferrous iron transport protein B [bacterium]|nr:ferrous iron transport protein B [bacterium]
MTKKSDQNHHERVVVVALAGNPNAGKTSIFNALTGTFQHVGNYPGVTVEKKEGKYTYKDMIFRVVDLPGIYSLTAFSVEEVVARTFLVEERPEVIVDVVDLTNLDRNLYLAVQMMELGFNPVLALNFADEARFIGQVIDVRILEARLRTRCVETIANRGRGSDELKEAIYQVAHSSQSPPSIIYTPEIEQEIGQIETLLDEELMKPYPVRYVATKLLEQDREIVRFVQGKIIRPEEFIQRVDGAIRSIETLVRDSPSIIIGDQRHGFASGLVREATVSSPRYDRVSFSDQVDAVLTHRILGLPFFFFFMYLLFWLTFTAGSIPMAGLESLLHGFENLINTYWPVSHVPLVRSLLIDGIINGVGSVLIFLPNIMLLFLGIAALEDTGYMARAAFIMDKVMHKIGLHGKSFIPMLIGFGCTVPAIMATRTLENFRDRVTTIMVLPLISCGARLPIYMLLIPIFFSQRFQPFMLWLMYLIGICLAGLAAKALRLTLLKGENTPFVMELPPYRMPTFRSVMIHMWNRAWLYVRKAGTIILLVSVIMWIFNTFPRKHVFEVDQQVQAGVTLTSQQIELARTNEKLRYSLSGRIGSMLEPVTRLMGFDWKITTSFIGAFVAKEVFVAQLSIIYSMGKDADSTQTIRQILRNKYSALVGFCVMLFALIATPCMATCACTRQETGRWRWTLLQFGGLTFLGFILTTLVYQIGTLLGL